MGYAALVYETYRQAVGQKVVLHVFLLLLNTLIILAPSCLTQVKVEHNLYEGSQDRGRLIKVVVAMSSCFS